MFSSVRMNRLSVVVLERDERTVLRAMGALGAVHLVRTGAGPDTAPQEPPDRGDALARCDALLGRIEKLMRRLEIDAPPSPPAELPTLTLDQVDERLRAAEIRADEVLRQREDTLRRWGQVTALLDQVEAYGGLEVSFDQVGRFSFLHFAIGSLPGDNLPEVEKSVGPNVVLLPMSDQEGRRRIVAVTSRKGRFSLETALEEAGFHREQIEQAQAATMDEVIRQAREEKDQLSEELQRPREALEALVRDQAPVLAMLEAVVRVERKLLEAEENFPRTDQTVLITGWVPAEDIIKLRRRLQDKIGGRCVVEAEEPDDVPDEEIPVLLRNAWWLRPFQMLVVGYGLPGYRELEPTLFVAAAFLLMFGMMFGDVGHGSVLAVAGLAMVWTSRKERIRDIGLLLLFAGASSSIFGFIYGEYFGAHGWGLWHNPLEGEALELLIDAIVVGIVVISTGLVLNIINRFRKGDVLGGFLDKFGVAGAVFYWGVLALAVKFFVYEQKDLHWLEIVVLVVLPLLGLALKEPIAFALAARAGKKHHAGNLLMAAFESVIEVFEAVLAYGANTISFVRLAAYAMSHAAILLATFLMAREVSGMIGGGGLGSTVGILIIVVGNILTILLEALIATVQAIRLTYYEFFSKFFTGTGRAFQPFELGTREEERPLKG